MPACEAFATVERDKRPGYNGPILGLPRKLLPEDRSQLGD